MLYIGNFSYTDLEEDSDNYCLLPAVVDAPDADTALERFSDLLRRMHDTSTLLSGAKDVFLDSLVEVGQTPSDALLVQWQKIVAGEDGLYSVLQALPGDEEIAEAYSWGQEDEAEDEGEGEGEVIELFAGEADDAADGEDEFDPQELADALEDVLKVLATNDLEALDDEDLSAEEDAFISF